MSEIIDKSFVKPQENTKVEFDNWVESTEKNLNTLINETEGILKSLLTDDTIDSIPAFKNDEKTIKNDSVCFNRNSDTNNFNNESIYHEKKLKLQINQLSRKIKHLENKKREKIKQLHEEINF